jgi:hypothetical protein
MPSLSYQEKSLYGSLFAELVVYIPYFLFHRQNSISKVAAMIVGIIVLQIILQSLIAAFTRNRLTDERDRLIQLRGYRAGYFTIITLMTLGLAALWIHTAHGDFNPNHPWVGLHFLSVFFGILIIADIVKTITQIIAYRRAV